MTAFLVPLGQVLGIAFASGLNLYATVVVLGAASRLELLRLPPALHGLESGVVIGSAAVLFLMEFFADKDPRVEWLWDTVHTLVRPLAATLLAAGVLLGSPPAVQIGGAAAAAAVALAVHGAKAGFRVSMRAHSASWRCRRVSLAEDAAAVVVSAAALAKPELALAAVAGALLVVLLFGRRLWRASILGLRALLSRVRRFFRGPRWDQGSVLPGSLRQMLPSPRLGGGPARVVRAAAQGLPGVGPYQNGWLVLLDGEADFLFWTGLRARRVRIPAAAGGELRPGPWADLLALNGERAPIHLFVLKDGPPPEAVLDELLTPRPLAGARG